MSKYVHFAYVLARSTLSTVIWYPQLVDQQRHKMIVVQTQGIERHQIYKEEQRSNQALYCRRFLIHRIGRTAEQAWPQSASTLTWRTLPRVKERSVHFAGSTSHSIYLFAVTAKGAN